MTYLRLAFLCLVLSASTLLAQRDRITALIDPTRVVALGGNLRPAAMRQNDQGRVDGDFPLPGMTLFLQPSDSQRADLLGLLDQQQNPASPLYHQWLTPEEYADRFGLSRSDISTTTDWLRSHGFAVNRIARSRAWITFGGTARQAETAFHTEIHRYLRGGKSHFANASDLSIPVALAGVVLGLDGLDDFTEEHPDATSPSGVHTLAPDDLATIYDIASLYQAGIDGTGQNIAIAGSTDFDASALADVAAFRAKYNLPPKVPQVVLDTDYPDPGVVSGSLGEAHLDVEWSGAVARNAQIVYVYSGSYIHALTYIVDNNLAPVVSMSANDGCEAQNTSANATFYQGIARQANTQGMTWVISGGDAGPAACDANGATLAVGGLATRFPATIPEVTAVGGTEFDEQGGTYWSATNTANGASALSYIPEMVWNDALALKLLWAGGGGTSIFFAKPAWQFGPGVPNDGARDVPDLAMAASISHDGYNVINGGAAAINGGTSASAPVFAGVVALLNQYVVSKGVQSKPGLGNINPSLYRLARAGTGAFHDITMGSNIVPCGVGTPNCPTGTMGFSAGPGYDLASGLGSVDVAKFLNLEVATPPEFFAGDAALGGGVYYLQFPNNNVFGYYNFPSYPILYHYDLGFESFIDALDGNAGAYLFDFASTHWFYSSPSLFPYLYDFTLTSWLYYLPNTKSPGHYTTNPRYFSNLTSGKIITM
jgi:subtilase family serine protease